MKQLFQYKTLPFWLFTSAALFVLVFSQLIQDGVFTDGILYTSVSKNLAEGYGNFWEPHFSPTLFSVFREQPPLYFGLLAFFYKIMGTSMYVERFFCMVCLLVTLFYIHNIWKIVSDKQEEQIKNSWLPILFFITIPVCFWAYSNHVEETVMTLFATMSVYYISKSLFFQQQIIFNLMLAGVCIFLSSLTKGIQGLFPVASVFFFWLLHFRTFSFRKCVLYSAILVGMPLLIYSLLFLLDKHIYEVLSLYLENRLGKAFLEQVHDTTTNRFEIIIRLLMELIPMLVMMGIIYLTGRNKPADENSNKNTSKISSWLLLIGLSGSIPLMVTLEQRGFYLVTSLPFYALAGALLVSERLKNGIDKIKIDGKRFKIFNRAMMLVFIISIVFTISKIGHSKRDKALLADVYAIGKIIPHGGMAALPDEMAYDYSLRQYLIRYFYIGSDNLHFQYDYFILRKNLPRNLVPAYYFPYPLQTQEVDLYKLVK